MGRRIGEFANRQTESVSVDQPIAPPTAFAIPYFLAYRDLHLLDTQLGLIIVYLTFNISLVI